jgi:metallo-beta-lactamase family protein
MCTAGRIKHHLKHNLWRPGASIVIVGFQAEGTTGRRIVDGAKSVTIFREPVAVKAKVFTIGGFSAHADQAGLLEWVGRFADHTRPKVFTIHGEPVSCDALAAKIREQFGLDVHVPTRGEALSLDPTKAVPVKPPERTSVDLQRNMLDLTTDLEAEVSRLKDQLATNKEKVSKEDLEKLKEIREELQALFLYRPQ